MSCDWWWSLQTTAAVEAEIARLAESKRVQAAAAVKAEHARLTESESVRAEAAEAAEKSVPCCGKRVPC